MASYLDTTAFPRVVPSTSTNSATGKAHIVGTAPLTPRVRTKSTPLQAGSPGRNSRAASGATRGNGTTSNKIRGSGSGSTPPGPTRQASTSSGSDSPAPTQSQSQSRKPIVSQSASDSGSRIPTRPRSKSSITSRSKKTERSGSGSSSGHSSGSSPRQNQPPLPPSSAAGAGGGPSSIPVRKVNSRSPTKQAQVLPSATTTQPWAVPATLEVDSEIQSQLVKRGSLELPLGRAPEAYIKNELPPFVMLPEEAMRIAERGHDLAPASEGTGAQGAEDVSTDVGTRKRAETMAAWADRPAKAVAEPEEQVPLEELSSGERPTTPRSSSPPTSGSEVGHDRRKASTVSGKGTLPLSISRNGTTHNLGLGQPSSRRAGSTSKPRAVTSATARAGSSPPNTISPSSRSASLGKIASPSSAPGSRLGVAAHLVPPENTWTPPKGADWDDVVLPAVAKKLGINDLSHLSPTSEPQEGDLAVEWDRDGTPIKWVKRPNGGANDVLQAATGTPTRIGRQGGLGLATENLTPRRGPGGAFSPTFEPSPENPLHPGSSKVGSSRLGEPIELSPLRTSASQSTPLGAAGQPAGLPAEPASQGGASGISRKPSMLRKPDPSISRQASSVSLRNPGAGAQFGSPRPAPTPGTTHHFSEAGFRNGAGSSWSQSGAATPTAAQGHSAVGAASRDKKNKANASSMDDGSHGKGCGCVIM
jgi:hypothetical protein